MTKSGKFDLRKSLRAALALILCIQMILGCTGMAFAAESNETPSNLKIEAETGVVSNGAQVTDNPEASGGACVGNIGEGGGAGAVTLTVDSQRW